MPAVIVDNDDLLALVTGARLAFVGIAVIFHLIDTKVVVVFAGHVSVYVFLLVANFNQVILGLADAIVIFVLSFSTICCTLRLSAACVYSRGTVFLLILQVFFLL